MSGEEGPPGGSGLSGGPEDAPEAVPTIEELFPLCFERTAQSVVVHLAATDEVVANPAAVERFGPLLDLLVGHEVAETAGRILDELGEPRSPAAALPFQAARSHDPVVTIIGVERPDRATRWFEASVTPVAGADGAVAAVISTFGDITGERTLTDELLQAQEHLRLAAGAGRVGLWEWDPELDRLGIDDQVAELIGRPDLTGEVPGATWRAALHPEDRAQASGDLLRAGHRGEAIEAVYRAVHPDGAVRRLLVQARPVSWDGQGAPTRVAGAIVDVTDVGAADERVQELAASISDAYYTLDDGFRFTYVNPQAEALLGFAARDLAGGSLWERFPETLGTAFESHYRHTLETGEATQFKTFYPPHARWYDVRVHRLPDGLAVFFQDVTREREAREERLRLVDAEQEARTAAERASSALAYARVHDPLTGFPNRAALTDQLQARLDEAEREGRQLAVCYLDLDRFKLVNDSYGHLEGDRLLVSVARRLSALVRPGQLLARVGSDEFVVVIESPPDAAVEIVAGELVGGVRHPFAVGGRRFNVTASVGVAIAEAGATAATLLRDADVVVHQAKRGGGDRVERFDERVREAIVNRLEVEADLRDALRRDELVLHYQPIFPLRSDGPVMVEALVRWHHPTRGLLGPGEFVPVAEETNLVHALDTRVLDLAGQQAREWLRSGLIGAVWVNVSARQFDQPRFLRELLEQRERVGLGPGELGIELTETALLADPESAGHELGRLHEHGVLVAVDDFGVGYSSLARLLSFRVHELKIDRGFVAPLPQESARPIVGAVCELAHAIQAWACAEGVETAGQLDALRELGADWISGYHLARPVPPEQLADAIRSGGQLLQA